MVQHSHNPATFVPPLQEPLFVIKASWTAAKLQSDQLMQQHQADQTYPDSAEKTSLRLALVTQLIQIMNIAQKRAMRAMRVFID